jgi:hypothetical protein
MTLRAAARPAATTALLAVCLAAAAGCGVDRASRESEPSGSAGAATSQASALPTWSQNEWDGGVEGHSGTQVDLRAGEHDGYDRVVLVFADSVPRYTVAFVEDRPRQCGSGRPVEWTAPAYATITLESARAHNQRGRATVQTLAAHPALPVVRTASLMCDFEGRVEWALGLDRRVPIRAFELASPARLVIDFQH